MYCLLAIVAAWRYLSVSPPKLSSPQPISILKPLAGLDLELEANLRTFFEQDYASFEILFAVKDAEDPAVEVVAKLQREYEENDLFPPTDVTEDWLKLTDFDPDNVIKLGPVRPIKRDAQGSGVV